MRPSHLYTTRALAGLLNLRDAVVPTVSRQSLFQNLLGYLQDPFLVAFELGVRGEDPEEGLFNVIDNPPTNPHLKLGYHIAHDCSVLLQHVSKNLK